MKKLLLSLAVMLAFANATSASAEDLKLKINGGWKYDLEKSYPLTVEYQQKFGEIYLANNVAANAYDQLVVNVTSIEKVGLKFEFTKVDVKKENYFDLAVGKNTISITELDNYIADGKLTITLQGKEVNSSVVLTDCPTLSKSGVDEGCKLSVYWGSSFNIYSAKVTANADWAQFCNQDVDFSKYSAIKIELDEAADGVAQFKVEYGEEDVAYPAITGTSTIYEFTNDTQTAPVSVMIAKNGTFLKVKSVTLIARVAAGVADVESDATIVSVEYYNLSGAKIESPVKGLNIVKTYMSNGSVKITKRVVR